MKREVNSGSAGTKQEVNFTAEELAEYEAEAQARADYEANDKYKDDRKKAYASIGDQLDMIYWDMKNGSTTFIQHIESVKVAHPKPEGI